MAYPLLALTLVPLAGQVSMDEPPPTPDVPEVVEARQVETGSGSADEAEPAAAEVTEKRAAPAQAMPWAFSAEAALDVPGGGFWPMASTRLDLRYRVPLPLGVAAEMGLRSGYGYRAFKGEVRDPNLGSDEAALASVHLVPVYGVAAIAYAPDKGRAPFGVPLRASVYGGAGVVVGFGRAQSFGRVRDLQGAWPAWACGGTLEVQQSAGLHYGLFAEWEQAWLDLRGLPGFDPSSGAARVGFVLAFAFGA